MENPSQQSALIAAKDEEIATMKEFIATLKEFLDAAIKDANYFRAESESRLEGLLGCTESKRILIDKSNAEIAELKEQLESATKRDECNDLKAAIKTCSDSRDDWREKFFALENNQSALIAAKLPNGKVVTNVYDAYREGLEQADVLIAAAFLAAGDVCVNLKSHKTKRNECVEAQDEMADICATEIRALTPSDAQAALDKYAEEKSRELVAAAFKAAEDVCIQQQYDGNNARAEFNSGCIECEKAIRALTPADAHAKLREVCLEVAKKVDDAHEWGTVNEELEAIVDEVLNG